VDSVTGAEYMCSGQQGVQKGGRPTLSRQHALLLVLPIVVACAALGCARGVSGPDGNTWRFLPGTVEPLSVAAFRNGRQCWVYLPPGYAVEGRRYPVLYLNDGEYAFDGNDGRHVNRICEDLIRRGEIEPIIVVAIENGPTPQRWNDYTPWPGGFLPNAGGGDFYILAIRDTLKPEIDRRYRTLADSRNTAIAGESLGGLISLYAGYTYAGTYGKVGAFSPSYWWNGFHQYVDTLPRPIDLVRVYQDTGYPDDNYIELMEQYLLEDGFSLGLDLMSLQIRGAQHEGDDWQHRYPDMLRFLFPP
jgi:predicted alpha/beta superfamily hydrolase